MSQGIGPAIEEADAPDTTRRSPVSQMWHLSDYENRDCNRQLSKEIIYCTHRFISLTDLGIVLLQDKFSPLDLEKDARTR
ncbi:hypothetical protein NPIL_104671 [Nephila pilipes]|uniref:Uncharacterized protein n=1 Tax=Nephila pilipes TaxID=299642 RepID=A0A8X6T7F0_NEPPI|nr:hypothetical protein NPIL_104671 [Nephila pilipes]